MTNSKFLFINVTDDALEQAPDLALGAVLDQGLLERIPVRVA